MAGRRPALRTLVVGVGNDDRGDDAVGLLVARLLACALADDPPAALDVVPWAGDPLGLLDLWDRVDRLVLIDAVVSGGRPGACRRYASDAPFRSDATASTHGLGLAAALALGRALGRLPARVEVWGIEGRDFAAGAPLTPEVALAVLELVDRLEARLRRVPRRRAPRRRDRRPLAVDPDLSTSMS